MCGPSSEQKDLAAQSSSFAQTLRDSFNQRFTGQDAILDKLNGALSPVIAAGPGQQGFGGAERQAMESRILDTTAANYGNAARAVNEQLAGRGGDSGLQSGVDSQIKASIATQAAQQLSGEQQKATMANYETGRENYNTALAGMHALSGQYDPQNFASLGSSATKDAFGMQQSIDQQKGAFWKTLGGAVSAGIGLIPGIGQGFSLAKAGIGALSGGFSQNDDYLAGLHNGGVVSPSSNE